MISSSSHTEFYKAEIEKVEKEWWTYCSKTVCDLIAEKELRVGRILGFNKSTGLFEFKVAIDHGPRQFTQYYLGLVGAKAFEFGKLDKWEFTYDSFRRSERSGLRRDGIEGEINTERCYSVKDGFAFYQISITDGEFAEDLKNYLEIDGIRGTIVLMADSDPPLKYLYNLKKFVEGNADNPILNLPLPKKEEWSPCFVDNTTEVSNEMLNWIEKDDLTIVQGPPGTGKSYNTALLVEKYLEQGKSVCVCALANKALMEFASQAGMENPLIEGKVFKTNLTEVEKIKSPRLQYLEDKLPSSSSVLLTTYYKLSDIAAEMVKRDSRFDVLIIEEASQAFLATIAMFSSIAKKTFLVGDPMQLPPIVVSNKKRLFRIDPRIDAVWNGMLTVGTAYEKSSYRLTKTRRLTCKAANQTGLFYEGSLSSMSPLNNGDFRGDFSKYFDEEGGATLAKLPTADKNYGIRFVKSKIKEIVSGIINEGPFEIAVLIPTKSLEIEMSQALSLGGLNQNVLVSTVHKVQGITVDYSIVYLPLKTGTFELDEHLFNVATSRARRGTLIISYSHLELFSGISNNLLKFLRAAKPVVLS